MTIFETVKENINTREAAERYGLDVNRRGMARCPFHDDRHPSLFIADDHYYCFGCGEHGDVIDLAGKLFGLRPYDVAKMLAADFGLRGYKSYSRAGPARQNKKEEAQRLREKERLCFLLARDTLFLLQHWKKKYAPALPTDEPDERFYTACHEIDAADYWTSRLAVAGPKEQDEIISQLESDGTFARWRKLLKEDELIE